MIEYCQEAIDWFEANVPYVPTNQQVMSMRLEDAIQHHDMVYLSDMGDTIVHDLAKLDAYCKSTKVAEMHHKQDLAKCQAIRNTPQEEGEDSERIGNVVGWLIVVLLGAGFLVWLGVR